MGELNQIQVKETRVVVLVSADAEWQAVRRILPEARCAGSPFGEYFEASLPADLGPRPVLFFHGGWGKIAAAASSQYAIDRWSPDLIVNLGTCGGFEGEIERGAVVLAERTLIYDIEEQMGDAQEHIAHYKTEIDLSWLKEPLPQPVVRSVLVSADRDLRPADIAVLKKRYGAVAGDWESGAIAWVAARNNLPCLILRGVTDLVGERGGEAYGNQDFFSQSAETIIGQLVGALPGWLECWGEGSILKNE